MKRRNRRKIFRHLSLGKVLPNIATLSALLIGLAQIRFALVNEWKYVILATLGASFLDMTDGRLARLFNSSSRFGAELDSLSDFVVFGVCPAFVVYLFSVGEVEKLHWMGSMFFCVCMCLRLARFNTHEIENIKNPFSGKFFIGVPAPAGALIALFPIVLYNAFQRECFRSPYFCLSSIIFAGLLCISRIPTFSIKKLQIKKKNYTSFMLFFAVFVCIIFVYTWRALCFSVALYMISIFFSYKKAKSYISKSVDE